MLMYSSYSLDLFYRAIIILIPVHSFNFGLSRSVQNYVSIGVPLSNINVSSEALLRHFPEHRRCYAYLKQKGGKEKPSIRVRSNER